jgi:hypothetical protein
VVGMVPFLCFADLNHVPRSSFHVNELHVTYLAKKTHGCLS